LNCGICRCNRRGLAITPAGRLRPFRRVHLGCLHRASACARAVSPWQACSCCHIRRGLALDRLGWIGVAAVVMGCGAPMVLLVNAGLLFAPAAHGGALFPGVMPLMVALLAAAILGEAITPRSCWGPSALSGPRAAHLEHARTLAIFSSCAQDWHGPATQSPCGARGSMACTPRRSQQPPRSLSIYRSMRVLPERACSKHRSSMWHCKQSCRES